MSPHLAADLPWTNRLGDLLLEVVVTTVVILLAAVVIRFILVRLINRAVTRSIARARKQQRMPDTGERTANITAVMAQQRREQRAESLGQLLRAIVTAATYSIAILVILTNLGVDIGPLLASAGVLGVALGFGAQTLVKDFLAGIFLVSEDQFGVGDHVDLGPAVGTVEEVGLRITRLRDNAGVTWYVRNGEILRVGNRSQGWSLAVVEIAVDVGQNLDAVRRVVDEVGEEMVTDSRFHLVGRPQYVGVDRVTNESISLRIQAKTSPDERAEVGRELLARLKRGFDEEGIATPIIATASSTSAAGHNPPATPRLPQP